MTNRKNEKNKTKNIASTQNNNVRKMQSQIKYSKVKKIYDAVHNQEKQRKSNTWRVVVVTQ